MENDEELKAHEMEALEKAINKAGAIMSSEHDDSSVRKSNIFEDALKKKKSE